MKVKYKEEEFNVKEGIMVEELLKKEIEENKYMVVGSIVNNEYQMLDHKIKEDSEIKLLDISSREGKKIYRRTLIYIMAKAIEEIYPEINININYQLPNAMFCDMEKNEITEEMLKNIEDRMKKIVEEHIPIKQIVMNRNEAEEFYEKNRTTKGKLQFDLKSNKKIYMYYCNEYYNYCYGLLGNNTRIARCFKLSKYETGFLLRYPDSIESEKIERSIKMKKLSWALSEYDEIHKILGVNTLYKLKKTIEENGPKDIILIDEALHEKKISEIATKISKDKNVKMVLIAGPSSSGKTTFAQRLGIQLRLNKIKPVTLSVDNYFVERPDTPLDENGEYDFETINAIDLNLFNDHLKKLLNGEEIEVPQFDFLVGTKKYNGKKMKLAEDEVLVIEGIHCLNDELTKEIPLENKYKIYISALTVLNIDRYNRISTTDTRLIRRIARDYQFRGYSASHTIKTWGKVNDGEKKNIFPFQEQANSIFNTSLIYEIGVLKQIVMPLLEEIPNTQPEYAEAQRLINILKYFKEIPKKYVPSNSLLREFTGGGDFEY